MSIILFIDNNWGYLNSKKTKIFCNFPGSSSFTTPQFHSHFPDRHNIIFLLSTNLPSTSIHSYTTSSTTQFPLIIFPSLISPQNISIYHNFLSLHFFYHYSSPFFQSSSSTYTYFICFIKYSNYRSYITYT